MIYNRNKDVIFTKKDAFDFENDPYEKGFADKLYEDCDYDEYEEPQAPKRDRYSTQRSNQGMQQFQQVYSPDSDAPKEFPEDFSVNDQVIPRKKRRKKRSFLRRFGMLVLGVIVCVLLFALILHMVSKQPMGNENLGEHSKDSCTILLAGTDESGDRTDTIMLMNVNKKTKKISLMSIPRDTKVNSTYVPHQINIAYGVNGKGEEGMESLMDYVADCIGFRPDGYVLLELDVFIDLVDLLGGVEFDVPMDMDYEDPSQDLYIHLKKGTQILNGQQAMGLVRFRYGYADADIGRVSVQRDFMRSAITQWVSFKNTFKAKRAMDLLLENTITDLSKENMIWLGEAVLVCGTDDMFMTTVPHYLSSGYVMIDADEGYLDLINTHFNPYSKNVTWERLDIAN